MKYNGAPRFYLDKIDNVKKLIFIFKIYSKQKAKNINLLKMIIPVTEDKFLNYIKNYIYQILKQGKNLITKKILLLNKGGTFGNQIHQQFFMEIKEKLL